MTSSRGGHNRKQVNESFFSQWSSEMAYVLGFIFADGWILNAQNSSRTNYLSLQSSDKSLIDSIRKTMESKHRLQERKASISEIFGKKYNQAPSYRLRIGSRIMYRDLIVKGVTSNKSLDMSLPSVPEKFFPFFLRGYFDGDGCLSVHTRNGRIKPDVKIIFTSGSKKFLLALSKKLNLAISLNKKSVYKNGRAYRLSYSKNESLRILKYIYNKLDNSPYLKRKYQKYQNLMSSH
jgi:hypothetical protein